MKQTRLRSSKDFKKVFKEGRAIRSPHFILYVCDNGLEHSRIGFSFSRSSIRHATKRNRVKRVARELWRNEIAPNLKGRDVVLVARARPEIDTGILVKEIKDSFKKAGISG